MAERQFGPYRLVRQIAVGGMAEIHLAKTAGIAGFEKYVALKMIHPNFAEDEQFIQMLVDEAKIAVQLTHGNIAQTFDLGRVGDTYYITMEYVDGADLYKILRRASEQDIAMPLDVCAFIGKEISSALDHAHRKRDHTGKSLGIVHRDVSPQNVLVSYSGEVKLVDFGIAKATMKARQTAVGVIKGKYYYMSPEQAWGHPIDHRSDIFSAGIVLYEMITGQMLYLEEDLHKLLEMARSADIAPPSKLRKGVPPQLERIVMHALAKDPGERYQTAGDFATDLERFLHAYSPVFTASKLSSLLRQVVGDPLAAPADAPFESIEFRDGVMSTLPLDDAEVAHAGDQLRDENSVIFRVSDLEKRGAARPAAARPVTSPPPRPGAAPGGSGRASTPPPLPGTARPSVPPAKPVKQVAPRVTRPADPLPAPARPVSTSRIPSITGAGGGLASLAAAPGPTPSKVPPSGKPRQAHEETRQLDHPAPANPAHEDSGLLTTGVDHLWDDDHGDATDHDLDNIGERTLITAAPGFSPGPGGAASDAGGATSPAPARGGINGAFTGFMVDAGDDGDGPVEATLVTTMPTAPGFASGEDDTAEPTDDDLPTLSLENPIKPARPRPKAPPPAALAAKIHAPAVSELRKPRPSRRTPPGGSPVSPPSVLQAIVSAQASEPMPAPRASQAAQPAASPSPVASPSPSPSPRHPTPPPQPMVAPAMPPPMMAPIATASPMPSAMPLSMPSPMPSSMPFPGALPASQQPTLIPQVMTAPGDPYAAQFSVGTPGGQPSYHHDASGLPLGMPTPPGLSTPATPVPGVPDHLQPYLHMQGFPPGAYDPRMAPQGPPPGYGQGYPPGYGQMSPGALYQFQPAPQPMTITGQMRLFEVDELASQYRLGAARRRWLTYIFSGILAVSVAAGVTFLIIRSMRESPPPVGSVHIESVPSGADVLFDGTRLTDKTPTTIPGAQVGTRHTIRVEYPRHQAFEDTIDIPRKGGEVPVLAQLKPITGKILVNSSPANAEIHINGQLRGRTPTTITEVDMDSAKRIELRLKDYQPYVQDLSWPPDGKIQIDAKLVR
ncbi:MAG TPA: protein kinase [Kofleriaceae bacterium]|nr:protein kinase [Kofleriaceae bacterium]